MKSAILGLMFLVINVANASAEPQVRVKIEATQPVMVGQQIRVDVTVLAPNFFLSAPQFPLFDLPGAVVTLPEEAALNSTEMIGGESYAGIQRSYLVTPQRAGTFVLPPASIPFTYAAEPGKPGVTAAVTLPPEAFSVQALPSSEDNAPSALVGKVVMTQTLDRDIKTIKAGEALTRTVETVAADTQAMMIPPPVFEAPAGVRVYVRDPVVDDVKNDRGNFTGGRRIDSATYVFETPGSYVLPTIDIAWFDQGSGRQQVASAPGIDVTVAPAPAEGKDLAPPQPEASATADANDIWQRLLAWPIGFGAAAIAALCLAFVCRTRIANWLRARRKRRDASEAAAFARLRKACSAGDDAEAYRALGLWAHRLGYKSIAALRECAPALSPETSALERRLFSGESVLGPWNGASLFNAAIAARGSQRAAGRTAAWPSAALPPLNP
jgi:BatD DUF11 like domain